MGTCTACIVIPPPPGIYSWVYGWQKATDLSTYVLMVRMNVATMKEKLNSRGRSKMTSPEEGGGSDRLVTNGDKGGRGVKKSHFCGDVIFERPLAL